MTFYKYIIFLLIFSFSQNSFALNETEIVEKKKKVEVKNEKTKAKKKKTEVKSEKTEVKKEKIVVKKKKTKVKNEKIVVKPEKQTTPNYEVVVKSKKPFVKKFKNNRSVSVITKKQIMDKNPGTVPKLLMDTPGIFVQKTNNGGGAPIIRGMIGPRVLITFDGVRLNNSVYRTGPLQYLNLFSPDSLSKIEVLRGSGSVLHGSDAMGGVLQLFPVNSLSLRKNSSRNFTGGLNLYSSNSDYEEGGSFNIHSNFGGFGTSVVYSNNTFGNFPGGDDVGVQPYSGYKKQSFFIKSRYIFNSGILKGWKISANYLFNEIIGAGRTDKLYSNNRLVVYDNKIHLAYAKIGINLKKLKTKGNLTFSLQYFLENKDTNTLDNDLLTINKIVRDETSVFTPGIDLKLTTKVDKYSFVYGGMYYRDKIGSKLDIWEDGLGWNPGAYTTFGDNSTYANWGLFAYTQYDLSKKEDKFKIKLSAGYRYHGIKGFAPSVTADASILPEVNISNNGGVMFASLQYLYDSNFNGVLSFSQGYRAPNLHELIMLGNAGNDFHTPNHNLNPEYMNTLELLLKRKFKYVFLGANCFISKMEDIIIKDGSTWNGNTQVDDQNVVYHRNGGTANIYGFEAYSNMKFPDGVSLMTHLAYTYGEEIADDGTITPLSKIPPVFGMVKLRINTKFTPVILGFFETYVRFALKQDRLSPLDEVDIRIPDGGTPGWYTLNFRAGLYSSKLPLLKKLKLTFNFENLLDKKYKYHASGLYAPGRAMYVSMNFVM
jgi:outer membrane cobalamin receptor